MKKGLALFTYFIPSWSSDNQTNLTKGRPGKIQGIRNPTRMILVPYFPKMENTSSGRGGHLEKS